MKTEMTLSASLPLSDAIASWRREIDTKKPVQEEEEHVPSQIIRIHTAESFCGSFPQEYKVMAFRFAGHGINLLARRPVTIHIARGENLWFAENDRLDIYATGDTANAAVEEFNAHLLTFYQHYRELSNGEALGGASRIKRIYQENFAEVPDESGSQDGREKSRGQGF